VILIDTSVWIAHFRKHDADLERLLSKKWAILHSAVLGELVCGNLPVRFETLHWLRRLPVATVVDAEEVVEFVERRQLYGKGLGWTDMNLLASALISDLDLWTLDTRVRQVAVQLRVGIYSPTVH